MSAKVEKCVECGAKLSHNNITGYCQKHRELSPHRQEQQRQHRQSPGNKTWQRRHNQSKPGIAQRKKYRTSAHGRKKEAEYRKSPARKTALKKYRDVNKEKVNASNRRWRNSPKGVKTHADIHLRKAYGISLDTYNSLLEAQNGVCAICNCPETSIRKGKVCALAVDHDHKMGKVRGLLCSKCNVGLGYFDDNPDRLRAAALYLVNTNKNGKEG